ncbi:hypothetical protein CY35_01G002500 [Sphagnum magellanicum]|jgi:hypothetical protein|nr:hypothetical protein CY35_01G002500 [Sphagnum magellanicum]
MMAQNTSEDKEISDLDSHETKKPSESAESIPVGASNDYLKSYVHKRLKDLGLEEPSSHEKDYLEFLRKRGQIYEEALGQARPLNDTRSEAERVEDVKRIEDLLVRKMVNADFHTYRQGQPACGRIECWAASQKFVNIVVALIRPRGADDPGSPTPMSKGLLALTIAAENNDLTMVDALMDIAVAGESFESREPDLFSPHPELNFFYSDCDRPVYKLYPSHEVWLCPIEAAARLGHVDMVAKLIDLLEAKMEADQEKRKKELVEAMMEKFSAMMTREKLKCQRAFNWAVKMEHREVVELLIDRQYIEDLNEASDVHGLLNNADVKTYGLRQTPLALAVLSAKFEMVKFLCRLTKGDLRTDAKNLKGKSAIQMAFKESRYGARANYASQGRVRYQIWEHIMKRRDSLTEVKKLTEERKVHVDAINAILVGTALIATATFAGWLSPPLGYSSPPGMDGPFASVEGHPILEKFWIFNSLSFFFSIATFMVGANVAFPPPQHIYIGDVVQTLRWKLTLAYFLVSAAVCFVTGAFACAGFAVLPPIPKYTVNMALTVGIGVTVVAVVVIVTFFGQMFTTGLHQLEHKMELLRRAGQQVKEVKKFHDD